MRLGLSRNALLNLLVVLGSILFGLVLSELVLRGIGYANPNYHRPDRERGWMPVEGLEVPYGGETQPELRFNVDGMRGPDVPRESPEGVFRVAVLGDSFTEGREVAYEQTFVAGIEAALAGCPLLEGREAEVLNFGVSGFGTQQQLIDYRRRVRAFEPDLVLLVLYPGNDITNNSPALDDNDKRPTFSLESGQMTLPPGSDSERLFWRGLQTRVYNGSRVLQLLEQSRRFIRYGLISPQGVEALTVGEPVKDDWVMVPPRDEAWQEAWALTEALLDRLKEEVQADGAAFALTLASVPIQVHPDQQLRQSFLQMMSAEDLMYPNRRLAQWAERSRVPLLDPVPAMQAIVAETGDHLHGFPGSTVGAGHYNARGHAVFAEIVGAELCRRPGLLAAG